MDCPVIQTSGGTSFIEGLEDRTFPYGFSPAAVEAVVKSDLCLAIGTELGEPVHYGKWRHWVENNANRKWLYVEQDPTAIGVNRPIDVPLVGDLRAIVPQLVEALKGSERPPSPELAGWIKKDAEQLKELAQTAPSGRRRSTPRVWWSRRPRRSRRTASWCATAARPSSSSGRTRKPSRTT